MNLLVNAKCNLCGADDYYVKYRPTIADLSIMPQDYAGTTKKYGFFNRIVVCKHCGLVYVNPRDSGIKRLYEEVIDHGYIESWQARAKIFRRHLRILKKYNEGGNLLDIGCYAGIFIDEAKKTGYKVTAIEPSKWATAYATKKTGINILQGGWEDFTLHQNCYDIITMWDIVEHLEDPSDCFKKAYSWLRNGGIVAITTHNISSLLARLLGRHYPWLMRFHLYHFTPKTLSSLLLKNNLHPILIKCYTKTFSLAYFLNQIGLNFRCDLLKNINLSVNTGDLFMLIAKK